MKKEHFVVFIIGLYLLSYVLDAVVDPLSIPLATPYQYFNPKVFITFPFTTASIFIKAFGIVLIVPLLLSFMKGQFVTKAVILLVLISLMQLYSIQDIATGANIVPLEWSIGIALGGIFLSVPMVLYFIQGMFSSVYRQTGGQEENEEE